MRKLTTSMSAALIAADIEPNHSAPLTDFEAALGVWRALEVRGLIEVVGAADLNRGSWIRLTTAGVAARRMALQADR